MASQAPARRTEHFSAHIRPIGTRCLTTMERSSASGSGVVDGPAAGPASSNASSMEGEHILGTAVDYFSGCTAASQLPGWQRAPFLRAAKVVHTYIPARGGAVTRNRVMAMASPILVQYFNSRPVSCTYEYSITAVQSMYRP